MRRLSSALIAATAEAWPTRPRARRPHPVPPSHAEAQRFRRAEDRDLPTWPRKSEYSCCAATRDELGRLCIGDCGPDCLRRAARQAS